MPWVLCETMWRAPARSNTGGCRFWKSFHPSASFKWSSPSEIGRTGSRACAAARPRVQVWRPRRCAAAWGARPGRWAGSPAIAHWPRVREKKISTEICKPHSEHCGESLYTHTCGWVTRDTHYNSTACLIDAASALPNFGRVSRLRGWTRANLPGRARAQTTRARRLNNIRGFP